MIRSMIEDGFSVVRQQDAWGQNRRFLASRSDDTIHIQLAMSTA